MLDNDDVVYAPPTPFELAETLSAGSRAAAARAPGGRGAAAAGVRGCSWDERRRQVERIVRSVVEAAGRSSASLAA